MSEPSQLLTLDQLSLAFHTADGVADVLQDVSFEIAEGQWTGLVGETGCGKSVTASAIIRLLPRTARLSGRILFKGEDVLTKSDREMRAIRGAQIAMVFQDPGVALNPALKIGSQIAETITAHQGVDRNAAREKAAAALRQVGLGTRVMGQYAHELSGGMKQRVMIALAIVCNPDLILADEPTSSLDVTVQRDILALTKELSARLHTAVLFITHDLILIGQVCDSLVVMYAGTVVERGPSDAVLRRHFHPYTRALVNAIPTIDTRKDRLEEIEGSVPSLMPRPLGCPFFSRCAVRIPGLCETLKPEEREVEEGVRVRCHLYREAA